MDHRHATASQRRWKSLTCRIWAACLGLVVTPLLVSAEEPVPAVRSDKTVEAGTERFMRLRRSDSGTVQALETSIVRFRRADAAADEAATVDLIGAIHVGEEAYYGALNDKFDAYEAVLYELVAPKDENVPEPGQRSGSPLTAMQVGMKNLLDLQFQLDCIDYSKTNMVHADLSPREFAESMSDRGESLSQMFFRMLGQSIAMQSKDPARSSDARLFAALFARDRSLQLKRIMAEQFEQSLSVPSVLDGPNGSTIITVRNRRAIDVLERQLESGKKRIAIFYGAAHLPDFEKQLRERLGFEPVSTEWVAAWTIE